MGRRPSLLPRGELSTPAPAEEPAASNSDEVQSPSPLSVSAQYRGCRRKAILRAGAGALPRRTCAGTRLPSCLEAVASERHPKAHTRREEASIHRKTPPRRFSADLPLAPCGQDRKRVV